MKRIFVALVLGVFALRAVHAVDSFVVKDIRVEGLQRITAGTVFNYLPIKIADVFTEKKSQEAIRALFKTGFFTDIRLERRNDVLIVTVIERPSIASVKINGIKEISEDEFKRALKELGLTEGRIFNRSTLDRVELELRQQYFSRGFYAVDIKSTVTPLERNRVGIDVDLAEGEPARIREINIVGNRLFPEKTLLDLFTLGPRSWYAFFSSRDQYSKQKLAGDLERLRNFYQDQGFLEFNIDSAQVSITPDKEHIYITVNVTEGNKYTISGFELAGKFAVPEAELQALVTVKPGDVYSRKATTEITKKIGDRLANEGYAFSNVNVIPKVDKEKSQVFFTFVIDPGKRVYVRRINFSGNTQTHDVVLRREMRQLEGAWYSASQIQRSRIRLERLGFFETVSVETPAVPDNADQVDMNITVKERPTGNLLLGVGYSDADGVLFNASVSQKNLFGTGKELTASFDNSRAVTNFNIRYVNPYHTADGISRGFNIFSNSLDAAEANTAAYNSETLGAGIFYSFPLSESHRIHFGADYESIKIETTSTSAQVAQDFVTQNGPTNNAVKATVAWSFDTLNRAIFPTSGSLQRLSGEITIPGGDLEYYKLSYLATRYWPVTKQTAFRLKGDLGYGRGYGDTEELPFYKNFYAGGSSTVRGYRSRSLGPRDTLPPFDPIGGSRRVLGNMEYLFPMPGVGKDQESSIRLSLFVDAGMVYGADEKLDLGELRYSSGLAFNWFAPIGPISFSYAIPLNEQADDRLEKFQFTLGVPFR